MFFTGYHHLSYNLTVSDVHNITLRPYIEKSGVVIASELQYSQSLMFKSAICIAIRDLTIKTLGIQFKNSTNITLTGLTADNAPIALNNVFGEVNISYMKNKNYNENITPIEFTWTVPQSQYIPYTVVVLNELDLTGGSGVYISGCLPGEVILVNSNLNNATMYMDLDASCKGIGNLLFMCENTHFYNSSYGLIVSVQTPLLCNDYMMAIALDNITFTENVIAIVFTNVRNANISDCYFGSSSHKGAIRAINSVLSFMGNVTFRDNYNIHSGGALSLSGDSGILIPEPNNTYILFENNTAGDVGGAISFSSYYDPEVIGYCKIYVEQHTNNIVFNFSLNSAPNGGNAIYGAYLDGHSCYTPNGTLVQNISQFILSVSSFSPSFDNDHSVITSDPYSICFCDEDGKLGNCSGNHLSVYPGQVFNLSVAVLGDMGGHVKWSVRAAVDRGVLSKETQYTQISSVERCTYFDYSVLSNKSFTKLQFSLTCFKTLRNNSSYPLYLRECPLGFELSTNYGCECLQLAKIVNITCNITDQSIQRQGTTWIGVLGTSNTLAFSKICPFLYCNKSSVKILVNQISFLNQDIQCSNNRSGVLCGGCRDNFSLALGSNRCLHDCSNSSISLLIAFTAAGIALVFFIKILNLTVSQGTINGLIFYANIVGEEQSVLFSTRGFLSVFIAWVNLDLGIETCFFDGMDAYAKAWLQFVFPIYVWAIALFIIILSHYSIRASRLFGNNSVPVLATLILLTYSKLLRAVISSLSFTYVDVLNGSRMSVWERDGNIQYLSGKHIPLFVFAVVVIVLFWFPFTFILISSPWLQKGTHFKVLHWVNRLIPFFDAYTGPLKDNKRYWVGTLLLVRSFYLIVCNVFEESVIGFISIIFTVLIVLAVTGFMYKKWYLAAYELIYILNLGILAVGSLYVQYIYHKRNLQLEALVKTSVGVAFSQFIVSVIYHAYVQLREPLKKLKDKVIRICGKQENAVILNKEPENHEYESLVLEQPFQKLVSNFRESLLAYLDN